MRYPTLPARPVGVFRARFPARLNHLPHSRLQRPAGLPPTGLFLLEATNVTKETYLKPREAAEYLRSSTSTLAKARMKKQGPDYVRIGRAVRYRQSDLDAWMSGSVARRAESTRDATANSGGV